MIIFLKKIIVSGRFRGRPPGQDSADVREERVQLPSVRDILHGGQRVHGLGTDSAAPDQHTGRDDSGTQRRPVRGSSCAHRRHAQPTEILRVRHRRPQGAQDQIVFLRVRLSDQGRRLSSGRLSIDVSA